MRTQVCCKAAAPHRLVRTQSGCKAAGFYSRRERSSAVNCNCKLLQRFTVGWERSSAVKLRLQAFAALYSWVGTQLGRKTAAASVCSALRLVGELCGKTAAFYSRRESVQPLSAKGGGGGGSPGGTNVAEGGWNVGVRSARPAPRAPAGTAVGETTEPPGNDPPPSLPGPDASSHLDAIALSTQSCCAGVSLCGQ